MESAADIPEAEAQMIVDIQQADFVQRNILAALLQAEPEPQDEELMLDGQLLPEEIFKGRETLLHSAYPHLD